MAMTAAVKDELSRVDGDASRVCRRAEMSALLRFAGGLHIVGRPGGRRGGTGHRRRSPAGCARRSPRSTGTPARCRCSPPAGCARAAATSSGWSRTARRWPARPACSTCAAARCAGCRRRSSPARVVRRRGRLARRVPRARLADRARPRRRSLEITCPGPEAALALVGAARRIGIAAKAREVRGVDRVVVRDGDAIAALLTRLGAHASVLAWEERRMRREVRATANRLANFDDANLRRSARAAVAAARPGRAGAGDPRRRGARAPEPGRPAAARAQAGLAGGAGPAGRPADDQGRGRRPDPAAAGAWPTSAPPTSASRTPSPRSPPTCSTADRSTRRAASGRSSARHAAERSEQRRSAPGSTPARQRPSGPRSCQRPTTSAGPRPGAADLRPGSARDRRADLPLP